MVKKFHLSLNVKKVLKSYRNFNNNEKFNEIQKKKNKRIEILEKSWFWPVNSVFVKIWKICEKIKNLW